VPDRSDDPVHGHQLLRANYPYLCGEEVFCLHIEEVRVPFGIVSIYPDVDGSPVVEAYVEVAAYGQGGNFDDADPRLSYEGEIRQLGIREPLEEVQILVPDLHAHDLLLWQGSILLEPVPAKDLDRIQNPDGLGRRELHSF